MRFRTVVGIVIFAAASSCALQTPAALPQKAITILAPAGPSAPLPPALDGQIQRPPGSVSRASKLNPDLENPTGMLIEVSITKQRLTAWKDGAVVMSGPISTGMPGYDTPTGHFHVIFKNAEAFSKTWGVVMPWALNFHGNYFLHQVTHYPNSTENIGLSKLGTRASHGCVREGIPFAERLYKWARVGTPVWIH